MIPTFAIDFTAMLAPFMIGAAAVSIVGVVAVTVAVVRSELSRSAAPAPSAARVESRDFRSAA